MPTITHQLLPDPEIDTTRVLWENMANGDVGDTAVRLGHYADRSVQVVGTFGAGGSVSLKGSNDGGTTWATLTDPAGNAITFTSTGLKQILHLPHRIRPEVTAGDGTTSLDVYLFMKGKIR